MRKSLLNVWVALVVGLMWAGSQNAAADVPPGARERATLYQAEASKLLSEYHWRIVQNRPGRFTVMHAAGTGTATFNGAGYNPGPSGMGPIMAHATINFQPESITSTRCVVQIAGYASFLKDKAGKPIIYGPFDGNTPENSRYFKGKLSDAEKRMTRKHPEYAAR